MIWKYPPIEQVRRINRTWIVHGTLAADTEAYLAVLERDDHALLLEVCTRALEAARRASREQRDPKPDFYASLFRRATPRQRARYLSDHPWTLKLLSDSTAS
jgi:hypothetical protein